MYIVKCVSQTNMHTYNAIKIDTLDVAVFPLCVHIIANLPSVDYQDKASFYVHMLRSSSLTVSAYQRTFVTLSTCVFCLIWDCTTLRSVGNHVLSIFADDFLFFPAVWLSTFTWFNKVPCFLPPQTAFIVILPIVSYIGKIQPSYG